jgi:hypothetical protein
MEAVWSGQAHLAQGRSPYARHRPEETLLYQVIDDKYPDFVAWFEVQGRTLPRFVRQEFEDYLKCGRLEHGFLRVRCTDCRAEKGLTRGQAQCGAVTLIQRFGSALNLNVHFHMLIPDGVYLTDTHAPYFSQVSPPNREELQAPVERIAERPAGTWRARACWSGMRKAVIWPSSRVARMTRWRTCRGTRSPTESP